MRAARYARYSTDNQRETSIDDQLNAGALEAGRIGLDAPGDLAFADGEESASTPIEMRPGSSRMMHAAAAKEFEVLIIEALDRFSRDLVDQEQMIRRLEYSGIRIIAYMDGYDSLQEGRHMMRQIRGSVNEDRIREVGKKTHRGLTGQIGRGYHAGGISYGYKSKVAGLDAHGEPIGHVLEVHEEAAEVVRWIFAMFAEGWSRQRIVYDLNARRVPSPRGKSWAVSTLAGSPNKGSGILNNEIYIGRYIWNRSKWVKNPDSRKWTRLARPESEWTISERPQLAIVPRVDWDRVRERIGRSRLTGGAKGGGAPTRTLFGGLLACSLCNAPMIAVNANKYGCSARKNRGPAVCKGLLVSRRLTDLRLLAEVRDKILAPAALADLQAILREMQAARRRETSTRNQSATAHADALRKEIGNLVQAIGQLGMSPAVQTRLQAAEAELAELTARQTTAGHPMPQDAGMAALTRYKTKLMDLGRNLERDPDLARASLGELLGPIQIGLDEEGYYARIDTAPERLALTGEGAYLNVVAGAGFRARIRIQSR